MNETLVNSKGANDPAKFSEITHKPSHGGAEIALKITVRVF